MLLIKKAWETWNSWSLVLRIIGGLIVGIILAFIFTDANSGIGQALTLIGSLFVAALKAVAPVIVFFLVISALANAKHAGGMKRIIGLYAASTFIAGLIAVIACYIVPLKVTLLPYEGDSTPPSGLGEVFEKLLTNMVANPIGALADANFLGILVWACLIGIALRASSDNTKKLFADIAAAVTTVVRWVISFAPFGVMGLIYSAITTTSWEQVAQEYLSLVAVLVVVMAIIAFVTNPILVWLNIHKNPYPLVLRCLKDSGINAFFTRSSAANIPVNMTLCERLGLDKDVYSVSIPLGATINMAGACVTISVMAMTVAHTVGQPVDPVQAVILCVLAALSAAGASGVPGGSLLLIPVAASLLGVPTDAAMQMVGVGVVIGVIQDSCETAINSSSDALFTATAEYAEWNKQGKDYTPGADMTS